MGYAVSGNTRYCHTCAEHVLDDRARACPREGCDARYNVAKDADAAIRKLGPREPREKIPMTPTEPKPDLWDAWRGPKSITTL